MIAADEALRLIRAGRDARGRLLLALDFDGTLAPIVPRPDQATILPAADAALSRIARRPDTLLAIVSGRGLDDVRARVRQDAAYFAGNHGFEIEGPGIRHRVDAAERLRPELRAVTERLRHELAQIEGVEIEDKGITISVHYRRVQQDADVERVRATALREAERSGLRASPGKRIVEIRPPFDWHKGSALDFLIDTLATERPLYPVFIGDDVTDEDAFRSVRAHGGLAILVAGEGTRRESVADACVPSPERLVDFLESLADDDAALDAAPGTAADARR